jgi:hypothetical protein
MASGSRFASHSPEDIQKLEADQDATNTKKGCILSTYNTYLKMKLSYDKINTIKLETIE